MQIVARIFFFFFRSKIIFLGWGPTNFFGGRGGLKKMGGGGRTNEMPGTDYGTRGPMRGLERTTPDGANTQADRHTDMATL